MRIAIIADPIDNQSAGIHVYTKEMVAALIRTNPGHEILLIREKADKDLQGAKQFPIWNTRLPVGFASIRLFLIVPLLLHFKKADIVIEPAHFGPFNLFKRIKRVTIIHDLTPILFPQLHRWHSQILQRIFLRGIIRKADLIIANSDNTLNDIDKVYPGNSKKVERIYPGIGTQFKPDSNKEVLKKYKIQEPYFLFVGTIEPRKNLLILLEAFRIFNQTSEKRFSLVIAGGTGWKSQSFFDALNIHPDKGRINCTGFVNESDLPALYSNAVAFIYPSLYEGFGLPVVEALSCGTPVIAADNSSLKEAGGNVALYFDANDPTALANQMLTISKNDNYRSEISLAISEHIKKFNWDLFARQFWKSLEKL